MSQDPDEIREDIEATRRAMDATLDQIEDRVTPSRIVERKTDQLRSMWSDTKANVMGSVEDTKANVMGSVEEAKDAVVGGVQDAKDSVSGSAEGAQGSGEGLRERAEGLADRSGQEARRQVKGNPIAAGLIAFGVGALAGSLLPSSRVEERAASEVDQRLAPVKEELATAGQEVAGELRQDAQEAAGEVADVAGDAIETVKEEATDAAETVEADAESAGSAVKEDVKEGAGEDAEEDATPADSERRPTTSLPKATPLPKASPIPKSAAIPEPSPAAVPEPVTAGPAASTRGAEVPETLTASGMDPAGEVPAPTSPPASTSAGSGTEVPYEERTVEELLELAGARDITGRWDMTKDELVAALRADEEPAQSERGAATRLAPPTEDSAASSTPAGSYGERTVEELLELAGDRDITGRWDMNKEELVAALEASDAEETSDAGTDAGTDAGQADSASTSSKSSSSASSSRSSGSTSTGGSHTRYENRTVEELRQLAAERDVTGRSSMTKDELIAALRR